MPLQREEVPLIRSGLGGLAAAGLCQGSDLVAGPGIMAAPSVPSRMVRRRKAEAERAAPGAEKHSLPGALTGKHRSDPETYPERRGGWEVKATWRRMDASLGAQTDAATHLADGRRGLMTAPLTGLGDRKRTIPAHLQQPLFYTRHAKSVDGKMDRCCTRLFAHVNGQKLHQQTARMIGCIEKGACAERRPLRLL
jgi:hypothetical protein